MSKLDLFFWVDYIDESTIEKYKNFFKGLTKKLLILHYKQVQWISKQATKLLMYTFVSSIFMYIYSRTSFEVTLIILLVGVIHYSILRN